MIIRIFHEKVDENQQSKKSKTNNDVYIDNYFTKSLSLKMQFMSQIRKFENSDLQPFAYEESDWKYDTKSYKQRPSFSTIM